MLTMMRTTSTVDAEFVSNLERPYRTSSRASIRNNVCNPLLSGFPLFFEPEFMFVVAKGTNPHISMRVAGGWSVAYDTMNLG